MQDAELGVACGSVCDSGSLTGLPGLSALPSPCRPLDAPVFEQAAIRIRRGRGVCVLTCVSAPYEEIRSRIHCFLLTTRRFSQ